MSLLDDAIKQHLELKRKHGASEDELRELEDQAFGAPARPGTEDESSESGGLFDEVAEAPTQFLGEAAGDPAPSSDPPAELETPSFLESGTTPEISEPEAPEQAAPAAESAIDPPAPPTSDQAGDDPFEVPPYRLEDEEVADEPSAMEHEIAPPPDQPSEEPPAAGAEEPPEPEPSPAPEALSASEREEIASQPTQLYDFESDAGDDSPADTAPPPPSEEPEAPPAPPPGPPPADLSALEDSNFEEETGEETFFDEQSLSDELDQALDVPAGAGAAPAVEPAADEPEGDEEADAPAPPESEGEGRGEDLLEETPDFLQETPEGERLWFEQRPPKDFDFDD